MRVPLGYTATEIVNWHIAEEYAPGQWRPARPCGFNFLTPHFIMLRLRYAWRVFTGKYDVLIWGNTSGEVKADSRNYRDCCEPGFVNASKVNQLTQAPEHAHMPFCTECEEPWTRDRKVKVISFIHCDHLHAEAKPSAEDSEMSHAVTPLTMEATAGGGE